MTRRLSGATRHAIVLLLAALLLSTTGMASAQTDTDSAVQETTAADAPDSHDATLSIAALADAEVVSQASSDFETYPLIVKPIKQRGGIKGNIASTRTIEGGLRRTTYAVTGQPVDQLLAAINTDLQDQGYQTLYDCDGEDCGPTFIQASPGYDQDAEAFNLSLAVQHYRAWRKPGPVGGRYVAIQAAQAAAGEPVHIQLDVLTAQPRVVSAIRITATEMARKLDTQGRVSLYGLFFKTDSAKIKKASRATLGEIAKLLHNKPDLHLLVVGHTDARGTFKYNLTLSKERARAVVDALVSDYDIDRSRLKPWGVSFAAPQTSNDNAVGRSHNRRVELVVWPH